MFETLLAFVLTVLVIFVLFVVYMAGVQSGRRVRRSQAEQTFTSMGKEYEVYRSGEAPLSWFSH